MLVRYDPFTAVLAGVSAVGSIAGGMMASNQAFDEGVYNRDFFNYQGTQEQIGLNRDLDAQQRERTATISRTRAIFAAQGGGSEPDYVASREGLFDAQRLSLIQDSEARQMVLRTKAGFAMKAGQQAADSAMIKGITGAIPGVSSLYKEAKGK
tara:strand:+ start:137 stop:595 length:459 start_codon:yes stop_codon:yes gene_type:complete